MALKSCGWIFKISQKVRHLGCKDVRLLLLKSLCNKWKRLKRSARRSRWIRSVLSEECLKCQSSSCPMRFLRNTKIDNSNVLEIKKSKCFCLFLPGQKTRRWETSAESWVKLVRWWWWWWYTQWLVSLCVFFLNCCLFSDDMQTEAAGIKCGWWKLL